MTNTTRFTGAAGEVRWGYHPAALLASWTLIADQAGGRLTAQVVSHDTYRVSQQPLTFVVPRPNGHVWTWPLLTLQITGTSLEATVDLKE